MNIYIHKMYRNILEILRQKHLSTKRNDTGIALHVLHIVKPWRKMISFFLHGRGLTQVLKVQHSSWHFSLGKKQELMIMLIFDR
jgi:hypothetical protein